MKQTSRSTASVLHGSDAVAQGRADVNKVREKTRRRRLTRLIVVLAAGRLLPVVPLPHRQPVQDADAGPGGDHLRPGRADHGHDRADDGDAAVQRPVAASDRAARGDRGRARRGARARQPGRRGGAHARRVPRVRDVPRPAGRQPAARDAVRGPSGDRQDLPRQGDGQAGGRPVPVQRRAGVPVDVVRDDQREDPLVLPGVCASSLARRAARSGSSRRSTRSAASAAA